MLLLPEILLTVPMVVEMAQFVKPQAGKSLYRGKGMVPDEQLSTNYGLGMILSF